MSEQPDRIEELLRGAMRAHTVGAFAQPGLARKALRGAARTSRFQHAATAAASVAAVGAVTATGVVVQHSTHRGGAPALGGSLLPPSSSCYATASPSPTASSSLSASPSDIATYLPSASPGAVIGDKYVGSAPPSTLRDLTGSVGSPPSSTPPSEQIRAVKLADPAPGYPSRISPDTVTRSGFGDSANYWTATFLVSQNPQARHTLSDGAVEVMSAGPEATVLVIDGHPFDLSNPTQIEGVPVSGTTTVLGHKAWVTSACDQTDIVFSTGRFQVLLAGSPAGDDTVRDANIARLKAVAEALQGLQ